MARILYSMCGEGRGHAARVRAIVEALRREHEIILLAPDDAYDFLASRYSAATSNVFIRRIPGLPERMFEVIRNCTRRNS